MNQEEGSERPETGLEGSKRIPRPKPIIALSSVFTCSQLFST